MISRGRCHYNFYYCFYGRRRLPGETRDERRYENAAGRNPEPRQTGSAFIFYAVVLINPNAAAAAGRVRRSGGGRGAGGSG